MTDIKDLTKGTDFNIKVTPDGNLRLYFNNIFIVEHALYSDIITEFNNHKWMIDAVYDVVDIPAFMFSEKSVIEEVNIVFEYDNKMVVVKNFDGYFALFDHKYVFDATKENKAHVRSINNYVNKSAEIEKKFKSEINQLRYYGQEE